MLFNSAPFLFAFLPVTLAGFFLLARWAGPTAALVWATLASLVFYGWDDPSRLVPLILASIAFNFLIGRRLARGRSRLLLFCGVAGNLLFLGYFKYASFLLESMGHLTGLSVPQFSVALPIGISFFTFTQIAFLVDTYRGQAREYEPVNYALFVTYFPHLIAGPIIHHKEIMPQFERSENFSPRPDCIVLGLAWFAAGLFKKVIFADSLAPYADPVFRAAASGGAITFGEAWIGGLSYALQIYFDFSGYSDMAIGLALLMGIKFPLNFDSPYKASSLIDFWRRWHMTLSRFLRDYLYVALGGNRRGPIRRYANLMITMTLGGLWHGATWNFAVWGAIHGAGLLINHLWRSVSSRPHVALPKPAGVALTFCFVVMALVCFRAETLNAAVVIWRSMLGLDGFSMPPNPLALADAGLWTGAILAIALFAPNTRQILSDDDQGPARLRWRPTLLWAAVTGCLFGVAATAMIGSPTVFLYFRF